MYFSKILATLEEHLFEGTPLYGCFKRDRRCKSPEFDFIDNMFAK